MFSSPVNVIQLIEKNPITRLSKEYENRLIQKIQTDFTENQQHLFLASFFMYLNYDASKDFVIDFENVWKWVGFTRKDNAKRVLERHFTFIYESSWSKTLSLSSSIKAPHIGRIK